ncbi:MAG: phage tail assembly protein [Firmicutes bacterium]|nr:phage tail assembly protein [Bacillota bacterium]
MLIQTEYDFTLPKGFVGQEGTICRKGTMRLATAMDEIEAMGDARGKKSPDYLSVLLLSKVVVRLEGVEEITPQVIEGLFTADFSFLQNMYETVNAAEDPVIRVQCPHCGKTFTDALNFTSGE